MKKSATLISAAFLFCNVSGMDVPAESPEVIREHVTSILNVSRTALEQVRENHFGEALTSLREILQDIGHSEYSYLDFTQVRSYVIEHRPYENVVDLYAMTHEETAKNQIKAVFTQYIFLAYTAEAISYLDRIITYEYDKDIMKIFIESALKMLLTKKRLISDPKQAIIDDFFQTYPDPNEESETDSEEIENNQHLAI